MKCLACGLMNPDTAQRCDCGYNFTTKAMGSRFCESCLRSTTDDSTSDVSQFNGFGSILVREKGSPKCLACGSEVFRKCYTALFIPVHTEGRYRIIFVQSGVLTGKFVARRLK